MTGMVTQGLGPQIRDVFLIRLSYKVRLQATKFKAKIIRKIT